MFQPKLYISCKSLLLQKALENFLIDFDLTQEDYNFKISDDENLIDDKNTFVIAKEGNIAVPFTKAQLIDSLKNFKPKSLEEELNMMFDEFKKEVFEMVKKYEK